MDSSGGLCNGDGCINKPGSDLCRNYMDTAEKLHYFRRRGQLQSGDFRRKHECNLDNSTSAESRSYHQYRKRWFAHAYYHG
nr:MAG TPA: hypothetical protein [Caudoviricetes sp.]